MIGYYVHHVGKGHLHRAVALARALHSPVTGLSSLPRPQGWLGDWVTLAPDDESALEPQDVTAAGRLHWVPRHDAGLRSRMAAISAWIQRARPSALVVDVSVEVAVLARLHGIPVITIAQPGDRSDPAHTLGYDVAAAIIGPWPAEATGMLTGLSSSATTRFVAVGAISRFAIVTGAAGAASHRSGSRTVVVMLGAGGDDFTPEALAEARAQTPGWDWQNLGGRHGSWSNNPFVRLRSADVVVSHAGQNSVAEVAAARRPLVMLPQDRLHGEQTTTAAVLDTGPWPALRATPGAHPDWAALLDRATRLDPSAWQTWYDGAGAERAASVIRAVIPQEQT